MDGNETKKCDKMATCSAIILPLFNFFIFGWKVKDTQTAHVLFEEVAAI